MAAKLLPRRISGLFWVFGAAVLFCTSVGPSRGALNLVSSVPAHAQQGVSAEAPIVLIFNNPVFPGSVDLNGYPAVLSLQPSFGRGGAVVTFSPQLSADGKTLTLFHSVPFEDNRTYLLTLNVSPSQPCLLQNNSSRTPLTAGSVPHAILFTVGDASAPEIVSHTPADGGMLEPGGAIRVVFSEMVVQGSLVVHSDPEIPFSVELSSGGTVMTAVPSPPVGTEPLTCRIWIEAEDRAGHPLTSSDRPDVRNPWVVTLLPSAPDVDAPRVVHHIPESSQRDVDILAPIVLQFSEPIDIGSVKLPGTTAPAVRVVPNPGGVWSAEVAGDGSVLILKHSVPFVPAFQHTVMVDVGAVNDKAGNGLAEPLSFSFWTGEVTPPCILATDPANGAVGVGSDANLKIVFSEPMRAGSVKAELKRNGQLVLSSADVSFSEDGLTAFVPHPPLIQDGSEYELKILSGADLSGNQLVEGALPGNVLRFRTKDLERPVLLSVEPGNGATVHPTTASMSMAFSEAIGSAQDCVIRLWYLSGAYGPRLDASCGEETAPSTWKVRGGFSADRKQVVLRFAVGTDGMSLRPGDTVVAELLAAVDDFGNQLADGAVPRVWSFKVTDTTAPVLLELRPGNGEVVGLSAPVVIRTSKPLSTDHFRFEADGDWSQSATRISGRLWKVARRAISLDGCTVTLRHEPFPEADSGSLEEHAFKIVSATDPLMQNLVAAPGVSFETRFYTARRPRIERVEYQAPAGGGFGQEGFMADPNSFEWRELPGPTVGIVPRDSAFRVVFTEQMAPESVPAPVTTPLVAGWSVEWEPGFRAAVFRHSEPLPFAQLRYARLPSGEVVPAGPVMQMFFSSGLDFKGDSLVPLTVGFTPADTVPPSVAVEYRRKGNAPGEQWLPLDKAEDVPVDALFRVTASETLSPAELAIESLDGSDADIAGAAPSVLEWLDADGVVGSQLVIGFSRLLCGGVLFGDPPVERRANYRVSLRVCDASSLRNAAVVVLSFSTEDALPPRLCRIKPAADGDLRRGVILTYSEPVLSESISLCDLDGDSGRLDGLSFTVLDGGREILVGFAPLPPNPPGEDMVFQIRVNPGLSDMRGNRQMDARLANDPNGVRDFIELRFPFLFGDIDGDGCFGITDVLKAFRFFLGAGTATPGQLRAIGASGDRPSASDVRRLLIRLLGSG